MRKLYLTLLLAVSPMLALGQDSVPQDTTESNYLEVWYNKISYTNTTEFYSNREKEKTSIIIPLNDKKIVMFTDVIKIDNLRADQIYDRAKLALTSFWTSTKDVTQLDDPKNHIIISKGWANWVQDTDAMFSKGFKVYFSVKLECRDRRYRISIYDIKSSNTSSSTYGIVTVEATPSEAFEYGLKKNGSIKSNIYGLSWLAWSEVANNTTNKLEQLINEAELNASDDW